MTLLTREAILAANDLPKKLVEVPEWGGSVWVGTMSGAARVAFEGALLRSKQDDGDYRSVLLSACVIDEAGQRLFTAADVEALAGKSSKALDRVFNVALELNSIGDEAIETAKGN